MGRVDKDTARRYISEADILVNIGNTVDNMLPSKVLECVSSGKRVLNLCQIENCPSLPYFEKYGNSLALYTKKEIDSTDIEKFRQEHNLHIFVMCNVLGIVTELEYHKIIAYRKRLTVFQQISFIEFKSTFRKQ